VVEKNLVINSFYNSEDKMSIWGNLEQANIRQERGTKENIQGCESG